MPRFSTPSTGNIAGRALLVGMAAGFRAMTPLGIFAAERNNASLKGGWREWPILSSPTGRLVLQGAALGEMVMDKTSLVPPRTEPQVITGRLITGTMAGLAMGTLRPGADAKLVATLSGMVGSLVGMFGGYLYRTRVTKATGLPDLPVALVEDAAAILLARKGVRG